MFSTNAQGDSWSALGEGRILLTDTERRRAPRSPLSQLTFPDESGSPNRSNSPTTASTLCELDREISELELLQANTPLRFPVLLELATGESNRMRALLHYSTSTTTSSNIPQGLLEVTGQQQPGMEEVPMVVMEKKIAIPTEPTRKYVGRILGPRGLSIKNLQCKTDCVILVRGKGSVKDEGREAGLVGKRGWEHLCEPLHVYVRAEDRDAGRCAEKFSNAVGVIQNLLATDNDEYKRKQLLNLAIINGTYHPRRRAP